MKLGLLSDAHGNVEAFERAITVLDASHVDRIFFLGDAIGYLPGDGVLCALRRRAIEASLGNHEDMLLRHDFTPVQDEGYRLTETAASMRPENLELIQKWPNSLDLEGACGPLLIMHGSPSNPVRGYVYPDDPLQEFAVASGTTVFMGNTHRPFVRKCDGATFVNVGSCGLPRDCGNLGSVCVFDDRANEATILRFDIEEATRAALARCAGVAAKVRAVFDRRGPAVGVRI